MTARTLTKLDEFAVTRKLGEGGAGTVFLVEDPATGVRYAAKVFGRHEWDERFLSAPTPDGLLDDGALAEARRAIWIALTVPHPNVAALVDVRFLGNQPVLLFEVADGSLADLLEEGAVGDVRLPIPVLLAIRIGVEVAAAMNYQSEEGNAVHGDLKPQNILLLRHHALVADWGFSRIAEVGDSLGGTPRYWSRTRLLETFGDPRLAAAMRFASLGATNEAEDIFALGRVVHECVMGHVPFGKDSVPWHVMMDQHAFASTPARGLFPPLVDLLNRWESEKTPHRWAEAQEDLQQIAQAMGKPVPVTEWSSSLAARLQAEASRRDEQRTAKFLAILDRLGAADLVEKYHARTASSSGRLKDTLVRSINRDLRAMASGERERTVNQPSHWKVSVPRELLGRTRAPEGEPVLETSDVLAQAREQQRQGRGDDALNLLARHSADAPMESEPWICMAELTSGDNAALCYAEAIAAARGAEPTLQRVREAVGGDVVEYFDRLGQEPVARWFEARRRLGKK